MRDLTDEIRQTGKENDYRIKLFSIPEKYCDEIEENAFYLIPENVLFFKSTLTLEEFECELGCWSRKFWGGIAEFYFKEKKREVKHE